MFAVPTENRADGCINPAKSALRKNSVSLMGFSRNFRNRQRFTSVTKDIDNHLTVMPWSARSAVSDHFAQASFFSGLAGK